MASLSNHGNSSSVCAQAPAFGVADEMETRQEVASKAQEVVSNLGALVRMVPCHAVFKSTCDMAGLLGISTACPHACMHARMQGEGGQAPAWRSHLACHALQGAGAAPKLVDAPLDSLAPLPYAEDALEPHIDSQTMNVHYNRCPSVLHLALGMGTAYNARSH